MKNNSLFRFVAGGAVLLALTVPTLAQPGGRGGAPGGGPGGPPNDGQRRGPRSKGELNRLWRGLADLEKSKTPLSKAQAGKVVALVLPVSKKQTLSDSAAQTLAKQINAVLTPTQLSALANDRPHRGGPGGGGPGGGGGGGGGFGRGGGDFGGGPGGPPPGEMREGGPRGGNRMGGGMGANRGPRGEGGAPGGAPPNFSDADFQKMRGFMEALNPFYPPTGYATWKSLPSGAQQDISKRYGERRALLESLSRKSKGK